MGLSMFRTALISMFLTSTALADTWYVDGDGSADYQTIQEALDHQNTKSGDTIIVMPGTYTGSNSVVALIPLRTVPGEEHVTKTLTVTSSDPGNPDVVASTIIDGEGINQGFVSDGSQWGYPDPNCTECGSSILGFTIKNCVSSNDGGGVSFIAENAGNTNITIEDCIFENNASVSRGGAIYVPISPAIIRRCEFLNNAAVNGGGIYFNTSNDTDGNSDTGTIVEDCTFEGNSATYYEAGDSPTGGAIDARRAFVTFENNTFTNNQVNGSEIGGAASGGAMHSSGEGNQLINCSFTNNIAKDGGGLFINSNTNCELIGCTIESNTAHRGGGIYLENFNGGGTLVTLTSCLVQNNECLPNEIYEGNPRGGGIHAEDGYALSSLENSTVCGTFPDQIWNSYFDQGGNIVRGFCEGPWVVDYGGNGDFTSIQDAIIASSDGDEILVKPGTYFVGPDPDDDTILATMVFDTRGKLIRIYSEAGPEYTFIDGRVDTSTPPVARGIQCNSSETENTIIEGFTIQNCTAQESNFQNGKGGGLLCYLANPTIRNCQFITNYANNGAAIYSYVNTGVLEIDGCQFIANSGGDGAINCNGAQVNIHDCSFTSNNLGGKGGGAYLGTEGVINNCTFDSNTALEGGGAYYTQIGGLIQFINTTFESNEANLGGGLKIGAGICEIQNCHFTSNTALTESGGGLHIDITGTQGCAEYVYTYIEDCDFDFNSANVEGGAIYYYGHGFSVTRCTFVNNYSNVQGGSIHHNSNLQAVYNPGCNNSHPNSPVSFISESTFSTDGGFIASNQAGAISHAGNNDSLSTLHVINCDFWNIKVNGDGGGILAGAPLAVLTSSFENLQNGAIKIYPNAPTSIYGSYFCSNTPTDIIIADGAEPWGGFDNEFYLECPGIERLWINENGGSFHVDQNWWYPYVPDETNTALFDLDSAYEIALSEDAYSMSLKVLDGSPTFNLGNFHYTLSAVYETSLIVGEDEDLVASLGIQNGGITCNSAIIGRYPGSNGELALTGSTTILVTIQDLDIGFGGNGSLNVEDGAYLVSRNATVGALSGSHGTVSLTGEGTAWDLPFFLVIDQGEVDVGLGSELTVGYLTTIFQNGLLAGDGEINSDILNFGEVTPGDSVSRLGTLFIDGDYEQVGEIPVLGGGSGMLNCNITETGHSDLYVTGSATLGGGLITNLSETYDPSTGSTFRLLSSSSVIDQFDVVLMPGLSEGKYMSLAYDESGLLTGSGGIDIVVDTFANLLDFDDPENIPIAGSPTSMTIADFNNDSFDDIAVTLAGADENSPGNVLVLISDGLGGFSSTQQIAVGANPMSVTAGDFNNDASLDLAVACEGDNAVSILQNIALGDGTFDPSWSFGVGNLPRDITSIDINNDEVDDVVVVVSGDDAIELWQSNPALGGINFALDSILPVGENPFDIKPGDVNTDKDILLLAITNYADSTATIWNKQLGLGTGAWVSTVVNVGSQPTHIDGEDLNADGLFDLIISNTGDGTISVLLATDDGYLPQVQLPVGTMPTSISIVDFDNDGDNDIAIVADNDAGERVVKILRSDLNLTDYEQLTFASATELADGESPAFIDHGDMDGDGQEELVSVSEASAFRGEDSDSAVISMRKNTNARTCLGDVNFDSEVDVSDLLILIGDWGPCIACPSDLDGDGFVRVNDILMLISNWGACE